MAIRNFQIDHGTPSIAGIGEVSPQPGVVGAYSSNLAAPTTQTATSTTSGGGSRSQSSSQQSSQSGSYFSDPVLVDSMARQFGGLYESVVPTYQNFMSNPVNSDIFQTQLRSLLASLAPGEADSRQQLTDRFRAAGGLRSGAHAVGGARLEGDIIGRRQNAAGTLLGQTIQQMTQLLGLPISQLAPLINALELQQSSSQGSSQSTSSRDPVSQSQSQSRSSGGGGGGGSRMGGTGGLGGTGGMGGNEPEDNVYTGGGRPGDWDYYLPEGGGGGGDDWNDYYNTGGDSQYDQYDYNLNTEIEVPGLGIGTGGGSGDDWNDFYEYGGDDYYL